VPHPCSNVKEIAQKSRVITRVDIISLTTQKLKIKNPKYNLSWTVKD
jgi:hypothetical protein